MDNNYDEFLWLYEKYGVRFILTDPQTKQPAIRHGVQKGVTSAHRDKQELLDGFEEGFGCAVVGGDVEGTDLFLTRLDVDIKNEDGNASLIALEAIYGVLPKTMTVATRSGGRHLYFWTTQRVGTCASAFKVKHGQPGIDIIGHHGYCCYPPSLGYSLVKHDIVQMPIAWELFVRATMEQRTANPNESFNIPPHVDLVTAFNKRFSIRDLLEVEGYIKINSHIYRHPFGSTSPANTVIYPNRSFLKNGADEISYHFGAHDKVQKGPHDAFDVFRLLHHNGDWDKAAAEAKLQFPDMDPDAVPDPNEVDPTCGGHLYQIQAYQRHKSKALELIQHHLWQKEVLFLSGASENYKTFWCMAMAFSMATGVDFLGQYPARPGKVVMVLTESEDDYLDRVAAWCRYYSERTGISEQTLMDKIDENVFVYFNPIIFTDEDSKKMFEGFKTKWVKSDFQKVDIWFLDHFSNNFKGDENSNNDVASFLNVIRMKARQENCAIVLPHHPTKGGDMLRGASVLFNNTPVVYEFQRDVTADGIRQPVHVVRKKRSSGKPFPGYVLKAHVFDLYMNDACYPISRMQTGLTVYVEPPMVQEPWTPSDPDKPDAPTEPLPPPAGKGLQKKILTKLRSCRTNPDSSCRRVDVKTIMGWVSSDQPTVAYALKVLDKKELVEKHKVVGANKYLWSATESNLDISEED